MRGSLRLLGIGLILAGLGLGGFRFTQDRQSDHTYRETQQALQKELHKTKKPVPRSGDALAVLRIPRFGSGYGQVVLEGISKKTLETGPGHFPGTAMPGEIGNFAVAGHRTGWGQPFHRLAELKKGDAIKVEWRGKEYTYRITRTKVVDPSDTGVVLPVPEKPDRRADRARITLTTCTDRAWNGTYIHRLVAWGELDER